MKFVYAWYANRRKSTCCKVQSKVLRGHSNGLSEDNSHMDVSSGGRRVNDPK